MSLTEILAEIPKLSFAERQEIIRRTLELEDADLTLSARELAKLYADIVSRGGRLLLNVGPTASGEIPAVQRRTLEEFAPWMSQLKPLTRDRRPASSRPFAASTPTSPYATTPPEVPG